MAHLGSRVSALLDGRLSAQEEERAWAHVHECHPCRDLVEREGWVKTRLARLSLDGAPAPDGLKSALMDGPDGRRAAWVHVSVTPRSRHRGLVAIGGSAAGAAVVGLLALGAAGSPQVERRAPLTDLPGSATASPEPHERRARGDGAPSAERRTNRTNRPHPARLVVVRERMLP